MSNLQKKSVIFIGNYFLHNAGTNLTENQTLYLAGIDGHITDTAWLVHGQQTHNQILDFPVLQKKQMPECYMYGKLNNAKILSPDTDVYNTSQAYRRKKY